MPNNIKDIIKTLLLEEHYKQMTIKRHNKTKFFETKNEKENETGNKNNGKNELNEVLSRFLSKYSKE